MTKLCGHPATRRVLKFVQGKRQERIDRARYDFVEEIADEAYYKEVASTMGIDINKINWSVSYSQGDGACFTGAWAYEPDSRIKIRLLTDDEDLWRIADGLAQYQHEFDNQLTATIYRIDHHYSHEHTVTLNLSCEDETAFDQTGDEELQAKLIAAESGVLDLMREFMRWIYRQIQAEYDYQTSDEFVAEMLELNR